jgi:hypothetical protein
MVYYDGNNRTVGINVKGSGFAVNISAALRALGAAGVLRADYTDVVGAS